MLSRRFRAMGTEMALLLDVEDDGGALAAAEAELRRLDALLSRFRDDSELSLLNRAGELTVGPELLELVELSLAARERTGGRFDPTVHDALAAAGYDRSFELIGAGAAGAATAVAAPPCGGRVTVDRAGSRVELEPGFRLDLGGIAKGWAADRVLSWLLPHGPALVDAGGDVAAAGKAWAVGLDTPDGSVTLELHDGGLATSGIDRRNWLQDGLFRHHIIDPATGAPAEGDLLSVTAAGPTATAAEVNAKSLFLAGTAERAAAEAGAEGIAALIVTRYGRTILMGLA